MISKPLLLIPAAGFGRRVGSPEAKELLPDVEGRPLIEWSLEQARKRDWPAHVILRRGKQALLDYLEARAGDFRLSWQVIESSTDCTDSVLQAREFWLERNLVVLPDTRFSPESVLQTMADGLNRCEIVHATFSVEDSLNWGLVQVQDDGVLISEKCVSSPGRAWGVLGFRKSVGISILEAHKKSFSQKETVFLRVSSIHFEIADFVDLTRPLGVSE